MRNELRRDEGLLKLSRGTRWLAAGALVSAGSLSVVVAETLPGRSSAATSPAPTSPAPTSPATTPVTSPPSTEQSDDDQPVATTPPQTFTQPTTPPQTVYNPPVASSGGS